MRRALLGLALLAGLLAIPVHAAAAPGDVVHDHASQRYDRSLPLLRAELRRHTRSPVSLVTWTEVQQRDRRRVIERPGDGWALRADGRTDVAISWKRDRWKERASGVRLLTPLTYVTVNGFTHRQRMIWAVLDDKLTGHRLLVSVSHMPSSVQAGPRFKVGVPYRVAQWKGALRGWGAAVRELRHRWHPDGVITSSDWNVDLRLPTWRHRIRSAFPQELITWKPPLPARGTHGRSRLIDATLTTMRGRAHLLRHTAASDHTAYRERLRFRHR